jgi:hypothetical protein
MRLKIDCKFAHRVASSLACLRTPITPGNFMQYTLLFGGSS